MRVTTVQIYEISMLFYLKGNNSKMGDNLDKKKICVTYLGNLFFHEESVYEISKSQHAQFKPYEMHQNVCTVKMPKMTRGHNSRSTYRIYSKVNQVMYLALPTYFSNFKALASIVF